MIVLFFQWFLGFLPVTTMWPNKTSVKNYTLLCKRLFLLNIDVYDSTSGSPSSVGRLKIERDNVTMQNEKQIIISSFKASISAILYRQMENCTLCPFDYDCWVCVIKIV